MFNNPFLEAAASSRNKRQQLDHLLRITAPHERFILAGIGPVVARHGGIHDHEQIETAAS